MRWLRHPGALLLLALTLFVSVGRAEDRFDVEAFQPSPDPEGSLLNVYGARTLEKRAYTFSLYTSYGRSPLSAQSGTTGRQLGDLVGSIGTLTLAGAVGIWDHLDLGVALPLHRVGHGSTFSGAPDELNDASVASTELAVGDLRLTPRVSFLARSKDHGSGLALMTQLFLPTGKDEVFVGEPFRIEPRLSYDWLSRGGLLVAANVGYLVRRRSQLLDARVDDMVRAGAGVELPVLAGVSALAEVNTQINVLSGDFSHYDAPSEGFLAARFRSSGWLAQLGGGPGFVRGISAPRYRLFGSLSYTGFVEPDSDDDGLIDKRDGCPQQAEDKDGFQDSDGCPDLDDDADGVPDRSDACKRELEDQDGFADQDGCPDPDNDGDGLLDAQDGCPLEAEDKDGFADADGCPEADNDQDKLSDGQDRCPNEPEDHDGFQDSDGCPDPDNDGDSLLDTDDKCPDAPGDLEHGGCPPPPQVIVSDTVVTLGKQVLFAKNSALIESSSDALLDELAQVILEHEEITKLIVEGHTDDRGSAGRNRWLAARRAAVVAQALISRGVAAKRLQASGVGPSRPLVPNDSELNRERNRRVEIHIARRSRD